MDTSTFIIKRQQLRDRMEAERAIVGDPSSPTPPPLWQSLFSLGMKWGLFPLLQEWALAGAGRWIYGLIGRRKQS